MSNSVKGSRNYTKALTTTALMVALGLILSQIKLFQMPQGGSVTLFSMLPIVLLGYLLGTRWGVLGGVIHGLLDLMFGGFVIHPAQLVIDYIFAFALLGLSGLVRNKKHGLTIGYIIGITGRYAMAVLSGVIFFGSYAPANFNALTWSLWYNLTYIATEGILTIILINIPPIKNMFAHLRRTLEN
ncbi:MAG: energy-coupled thiamine transporter ThiT [Clostridiales bacterium]|nr:energy-coupled thiamine transporter ThiT [Clostridiales bacterium]